MMFTMRATCEGSLANCENRLPVSMKKGAPGGWPTSSLKAVEMNSGQSQNDAVGSMVEQYTTAAMRNANHPSTLSTNLYCLILFQL